jgi:hypothetical protein
MEHVGWYQFTMGVPQYRSYGGDVVAMEIFTCPRCLTVEFRADEDSEVYDRIGKHRKDIERNTARRQRGVITKKCIKCGQRIPVASEECEYCGAKQPEW